MNQKHRRELGSAVKSVCCGNELLGRGMWSDTWDGESNKSMYVRCGVETHANGVTCRVVEWVNRNTLRWFGHIGRRKSEEFMKKVQQ